MIKRRLLLCYSGKNEPTKRSNPCKWKNYNVFDIYDYFYRLIDFFAGRDSLVCKSYNQHHGVWNFVMGF